MLFKTCWHVLICFDNIFLCVCLCVVYVLSVTWTGKAKQCCIAALPVRDGPPYGTACHGLRKILQVLLNISQTLSLSSISFNILHVFSLTSHENFGTLRILRFKTQLGCQTELVSQHKKALRVCMIRQKKLTCTWNESCLGWNCQCHPMPSNACWCKCPSSKMLCCCMLLLGCFSLKSLALSGHQ